MNRGSILNKENFDGKSNIFIQIKSNTFSYSRLHLDSCLHIYFYANLASINISFLKKKNQGTHKILNACFDSDLHFKMARELRMKKSYYILFI